MQLLVDIAGYVIHLRTYRMDGEDAEMVSLDGAQLDLADDDDTSLPFGFSR
jgi:hypothetical protein